MGVDPASLALIAAGISAAAGVGTALYTADRQRSANNRAADQAQADADAAAAQGRVEAEKVRKATRARQSEAVAALAASGVDVGEGTAEQIQQDIGERGEEDALNVILGGQRRGARLEGEAANDRYAAGQAMTAGYINAGNSALSSVAAYSRGWKGGTTYGPDLSNTTRGSGD